MGTASSTCLRARRCPNPPRCAPHAAPRDRARDRTRTIRSMGSGSRGVVVPLATGERHGGRGGGCRGGDGGGGGGGRVAMTVPAVLAVLAVLAVSCSARTARGGGGKCPMPHTGTTTVARPRHQHRRRTACALARLTMSARARCLSCFSLGPLSCLGRLAGACGGWPSRAQIHNLGAGRPTWIDWDCQGSCLAIMQEGVGIYLWDVPPANSPGMPPSQPLRLAPTITVAASFCMWSKKYLQLAIGTNTGKVRGPHTPHHATLRHRPPPPPIATDRPRPRPCPPPPPFSPPPPSPPHANATATPSPPPPPSPYRVPRSPAVSLSATRVWCLR